jgi:hypothetical protein
LRETLRHALTLLKCDFAMVGQNKNKIMKEREMIKSTVRKSLKLSEKIYEALHKAKELFEKNLKKLEGTDLSGLGLSGNISFGMN